MLSNVAGCNGGLGGQRRMLESVVVMVNTDSSKLSCALQAQER